MTARDATTGRYTSGGGGGSSGGGGMEVGRLLVRLMGDASSYTAMFRGAITQANRAMSSIQRAGVRIEAVGTKLKAVGTKLTIGVTAPLMLIGGAAVKSFASFDQAMTESASIMKVTAKQTQQMRDQALSLSAGATQGPTDLAKAYFYLASAGLDAEQSMAALPQMAKFATAGAFDMALATDLVTDAQSALGLTVKDAGQNLTNLTRVTDVLVKANTLANASVQQFSVAITGGAGAALKSYGKDIEEGTALLAAMADQGIKNELAGHNLARIMLLVSKASRDQAVEHKKLGFSVYDAAGKMRNFADIIQNLEDITRGMSDETKSATLEQLGFEARIQQAILPVIGTSQAIRRYEAELRKAGGTTKDVAEKQMQAFSNQMKVLKNRLTIVAIEIGERLAPIVSNLSGHLAVLIEGWKKLSPETKQAVIYWAMAAAALGPLLVGLGVMIKIVGAAVQGFALLRVALVPLQLTMSAFALIFNPVGILLVGIGALVVIIGNMTGAWKALGDSLKNVGQWFSDVFGPAMGEARKAIGGIVDALRAGDFAGAAKIAMMGLKSVFLTAIDGIMQKWGPFVQNLGETFLAVVKVVGSVWIGLQNTITKGIIHAEKALYNLRASHDPTHLPGYANADRAVGVAMDQRDTMRLQAEKAQGAYKRQYGALPTSQADYNALPKSAQKAYDEVSAITKAYRDKERALVEAAGKKSDIMSGRQFDDALKVADEMGNAAGEEWTRKMTDAMAGPRSWASAAHAAALSAQNELKKSISDQQTGGYADEFAKAMQGFSDANQIQLNTSGAQQALKDLEKNKVTVPLEFSVGTQAIKWGGAEMRDAQFQAYLAGRGAIAAHEALKPMNDRQTNGYAGQFASNMQNYSDRNVPLDNALPGKSRIEAPDIVTRLDRLIQLGESQLIGGIKIQDLEPAGLGGGT